MVSPWHQSIKSKPSILRNRMDNSSCSGTKRHRPSDTHSGADSEDPGEDHSQSSPSDYESCSHSEDDETHEDSSFNYGRLDESSHKRDSDWQDIDPLSHYDRQPELPQRAWYEFDLAVVVALVSPIGNWLTGGDHVKNLLFIVLLVFYLHKVIEVPWMLYQSARRRRRPPHLPPITPQDRHRELAVSELRKMELFFLASTTLSPFIGAYLLKYTTTAIMGPDSVSWFSTGLFVMATGMRPWSHLIERLRQRTTDLQDFIHYPPPLGNDHNSTQEKVDALIKRANDLENALAQVKVRIKHTTAEVFDYIDDAVDSLEGSLHKHENTSDEQEGRIRSVEESIATLSRLSQGGWEGKPLVPMINTNGAQSMLFHILPAWLLSPPKKNRYMSRYSPTSYSLKNSPAAMMNSPLETIAEEDSGRYPILAQPLGLATSIIHRAGYVITWPLRAVARMVLGRY